ncbi:hypothetical protein M0R45_034916 [Rubus argutus]|uniref:HAT C-terminal dimerisation domain-containing protein n=2 Tax=Rubus argutus TaxID=59490 RepID=A0AAW1VV87_RUBAR
MYDEYRGCETIPPQTNNADGVAAMEGLVYEGLDDEILSNMVQEQIEEHHGMLSNEVDKYLADRQVNALSKGFDVATWWKGNASAFPILSKLAKDIFAIPCSTVASENAFSLGKRVVEPFRSSLTPQMVEALVCTSDWLRAEQPNFYKEPTVEELELYQEIEELEKETAGLNNLNLSSADFSTTTAS